MAATPQNLLVIMSDEHNPQIAGYAGHPIISTPALDALATHQQEFMRRDVGSATQWRARS